MAWWIGGGRSGLADWLDSVRVALATLEQFPRSGRRVGVSDDDGLRVVLVGQHRLFYRVCDDEICVLLFRHVRRDPDGSDLTHLE